MIGCHLWRPRSGGVMLPTTQLEDSDAIFIDAVFRRGRLEPADEGAAGPRHGCVQSLHRSLAEGGRAEGLEPASADFGGDNSASGKRQAACTGWSVCGVERTDRRLLPD